MGQRCVKVSELRPHPNQNIFPPRNEQEFEELVISMENGQEELIYVTHDMIIISGHGRVEAAKKLEWPEIEAWVYDEDDEIDENQRDSKHIRSNMDRRQLDDLTMVRCYLAVKDEYVDEYDEPGDVRDIIAERLNLNCSGRTLSRLMQLARELPLDIQHMISGRTLSKTHALGILKLPKQKQLVAFDRLRDGESGTQVLRSLSGTAFADKSAPKSPSLIGESILRDLRTNRNLLNQHLKDLDTVQIKGANVVAELDANIALFTKWRDRKAALHAKSLDDVREEIGI